MRLLNVDTMKFEEFADEVPYYTILSHCWRDQEVTFQDLSSGAYQHMKGYQKILGCCGASRLEGYRYTWIDTCCIDKSSSSELSEAINSMWRWYERSSVCFAFLDDVDDTEDPRLPESTFARSRWFGRGWTLQELIAPTAVAFMSRSWKELGTKTTLRAVISEVTGIDADLLSSSTNEAGRTIRTRLSDYSVACRMSWAARRVTTRKEDEAYCLMGIFDVHLPLIYGMSRPTSKVFKFCIFVNWSQGEGEKAFYRLQLEILNQSDDSSILAWHFQEDFSDNIIHLKGDRPGLLAWEPKLFMHSGDIIYTQPKPDDARSTLELSKSNILLRTWTLSGRDINSGTYVDSQPSNTLLPSGDGAIPLCSKGHTKPSRIIRLPRLLNQDLPPAESLIALLDCITPRGSVGIVLERGPHSLRRDHTIPPLRFEDYVQTHIVPVNSLIVPNRPLSRKSLGSSFYPILELVESNLISNGYSKSVSRSKRLWDQARRFYHGDLSQMVIFEGASFKNEDPGKWPPFSVFCFTAKNIAEFSMGCFVGSSPSDANGGDEIEIYHSLQTSEVKVPLVRDWDVVLKVRQRLLGWRIMVCLQQKTDMSDLEKYSRVY